jgi:hypothetical protein
MHGAKALDTNANDGTPSRVGDRENRVRVCVQGYGNGLPSTSEPKYLLVSGG